ncbi:MAG: hypothetical protein AAB421_03120 [Patescibacteria group bacterium]
MTTIRHWLGKIKGEGGAQFITPLLVILVGLGGYAIGRIQTVPNNTLSATAIQALSREPVAPHQAPKTNGKVVASKTGKKYHLPWCGGARTIAEDKKVWFETSTEARAAGYLPAQNCQGIE